MIIHIILFTQWQQESKRRKGENYMNQILQSKWRYKSR